MLNRELTFTSQLAEAAGVLAERTRECGSAEKQLDAIREDKSFRVGRNVAHLIVSLLILTLFGVLALNILLWNLRGGSILPYSGGWTQILSFHLYAFVPGLAGRFDLLDEAFSWIAFALFASVAVYALAVAVRAVARIVQGSRLNTYGMRIHGIQSDVDKLKKNAGENARKLQSKPGSFRPASGPSGSVEERIAKVRAKLASFKFQKNEGTDGERKAKIHTKTDRLVHFFFVFSPAVFCMSYSSLVLLLYYAVTRDDTISALSVYIAMGIALICTVGTYIWRFVRTMANDAGAYSPGSFASLMLSALFVPFFTAYHLITLPLVWQFFSSGSIFTGIVMGLISSVVFYVLWRILNRFRIWTKDPAARRRGRRR